MDQMTHNAANENAAYTIRLARPDDCAGAAAVMRATFDHDFGYGYVPEWHGDVDDLERAYLRPPRHALFVAVENASGAVVGTTAVRPGGPQSPPQPGWLAARYDRERTAELVRVYIDRAHRRHGLARRLVDAARQFVANDGAYRIIYLHTHPDTPGAEPFWRSVASREVHNDRDSGGLEVRGRRFITIHFEIDLPLT